MFRTLRILSVFGLMLMLASCEREIDLDIPETARKIVVQGWIEEGQPPFIILSRNLSFYGTLSLEDVDNFFVSGAEITVSNGTESVQLVECTIDSINTSAVAYSVAPQDFLKMPGKRGETYELTIDVEGKRLTSSTVMTPVLPLDTIWYEQKIIQDSLRAEVFIEFSDPDTLGNFYRYFTKKNDEDFFPGINSTFDDRVINGTTYNINVPPGVSRFEEIDFETFGYFDFGDEVTVRISGIDRAAYDFWSTLEYDTNSGGPFAASTVIKGNVEGGLGIWYAYSKTDITLQIPEQ